MVCGKAKVPNVSGKAVSTFAGEAINIAGYVWDAQEIMSAVSADLKDDGQIGKDTAKATAKVVAGNVGGAVAGWAVGEALAFLVGAATSGVGSAVIFVSKLLAAIGGSYLAGQGAEKTVEALLE